MKCLPLEIRGLGEAFQRNHDLSLDGQVSHLQSLMLSYALPPGGKNGSFEMTILSLEAKCAH